MKNWRLLLTEKNLTEFFGDVQVLQMYYASGKLMAHQGRWDFEAEFYVFMVNAFLGIYNRGRFNLDVATD